MQSNTKNKNSTAWNMFSNTKNKKICGRIIDNLEINNWQIGNLQKKNFV